MTQLSNDPAVSAVLAKFPGAEIGDVRNVQPPETNAASAAGYSLAELAQVAKAECDRIVASQDALVAAGDRAEPHAGELERARKFEAIRRILDRVRNDQQTVDRLKQLAAAK